MSVHQPPASSLHQVREVFKETFTADRYKHNLSNSHFQSPMKTETPVILWAFQYTLSLF